ncbi:MAG: ABC transporter ATP-binding protein [Rhodopila sp.]|nr:ABC transporter ATP-binding protein [Rhodopila sp.]
MSATTPLLQVSGLSAFYGDMRALHDVSLEVMPGEIVAIVGANAAGKSTLLRALSSVVRWTGQIRFRGQDVSGIPAHAIVERGLIQVPEGRELFPFMTVEENLDVGSYNRRARAEAAATKEKVFTLLPRLRERRTQLASTMSGGEQQMCAIGRGLMAQPEMLLLDEPSLGLAPVIIRTVYEKLAEVNAAGTTVLLVEQNLKAALRIAHRAYVLESGRIVLSGRSSDLLDDPRLRTAYLGR